MEKYGRPFKWGDRMVRMSTYEGRVLGIVDADTYKKIETLDVGSHVIHAGLGGIHYIHKVINADDVRRIEGE